MFPFWLNQILTRSGHQNGLGMCARSSYYAGCATDRHRISADKLFLLVQEFILQEFLENIPRGATGNFLKMVYQMKYLRPDEFLINLAHLVANKYTFTIPVSGMRTSTDDDMNRVCEVLALGRRDSVREAEITTEIIEELKLKVVCSGMFSFSFEEARGRLV